LMVSRQETARPLLTPGEVMQLPSDDELVLVAGVPPIRAKKARYFEDPRLTERVLPPPAASGQGGAPSIDDWSLLPVPAVAGGDVSSSVETQIDDPVNGGIRREPELPQHEEIIPEQTKPAPEFTFGEDDFDDDAVRARALRQQARGLARRATLDPSDGMEL
jgi:type IV secretion system protein VirD4